MWYVTKRSAGVACLMGLTACIASVFAGPLDPPAGPVAPTLKTLAEIRPQTAINVENTPGDSDSTFKITTPGSYYLTGNLVGSAGKHGIEIVSGDVTIDLNGFELMGAVNSLDAIHATSPRFVVRDGTVLNWGGAGVVANASTTGMCTIEGLRVANCNGEGIVTTDDASVLNCVVQNCGGVGITVGPGSTVRECVARGGQSHGFQFGSSSTITSCVARSNGLDGFHAASVGTGDVIIAGCTSQANSGDGIEVGTASTVRECQVANAGLSSADGAGIHVVGGQNRIESNNVSGCDRGIDVDAAANLIVRNTCALNTINFSIVSGNTLGVIVAAGTNGSAINGSSAPGTIGTADPWSNVSY